MKCVACGARPVGTDSGRCFGCAEAAPGWAAALRPANGLATALNVLLGLGAVAALAVVVLDVWLDVLAGQLLDGADGVDPDTPAALGSVVHTFNGAVVPVGLATVVVFILWFHRTRGNADLLLPKGHRLGRGWTIGGWFTPIVMFWFPWQLMVDCWRASAPLDAEGRRRTPSESIVAVWWLTWMGSLILGRLATLKSTGFTVRDYADLESLRIGLRLETAEEVLRLVAAITAILMVTRLTAMQRERRADINPLAARAAQEARVQAVTTPSASA
ncbi:DUF4328 domain-containing protein [Kitasatospora sp. NPDC059088]|uniref:DUF4328 domain-containing protein n=1 Tax=Kitasatospora sp. NPDC059088 TaxID=3346722 RepID=UPI003679C308